MSNIYKQLGAYPTFLGDKNRKFPCFYEDGSTDEATKQWAITQLGFTDTRITYNSWCELSPHINVVPFTAAVDDIKCRLHPRNIPGMFDLEWAALNNRELVIPNLLPSQLYDCLLLAKTKAELLIQDLDSKNNLVRTSNAHYDKRFNWSDNDCSWFCEGKKVEYINLRICIPFPDAYFKYV